MKFRFGRSGGAALFALLLGVPAVAPAAGPAVTISPGYTSLGVTQTLQYTATVTGLTNTSVTWQVSGKTGGNAANGTITTGGLYTAPAAVPANGVTITAIASDNKTSNTVYVNVAPAGPAIAAISPSPVSTGNYTITLTGSGFVKGAYIMANGATATPTFVNSTTLTYSGYQGAAGSVPFQIQNPGTLWGPVFYATFKAGGPPPPQTISPGSATVNLGASRQFTSANATSWNASAGSITQAGLFTAPATMPASTSVKVTATGAGGSASATVTLLNPNAQTISPTAISLNLGATQQFQSTGATGWTALYGTVAAGFYAAPAAMTSTGTDTVTATGPNGSASATVTLIPPAPSISTVAPTPLPLGVFAATITGTGFLSTSTATFNGVALGVTLASTTQLNVTGSATQSGQGTIVVANGSQQSQPFTVQVGIANPQVSSTAARRFLENAAFGPSPSDALAVQQLGFQGWLNQQFAMPQVSNYQPELASSQGGMPQHFLTNAVTNPDQLRQRVGFALSQITVTSINKLIWNGLMVPYENLLLTDAFSNYRQILNDVTLSAAMGYYLDMANNAAGNASGTILANENYAREVMQLFSIGVNMLNQDGTTQNDASGSPLPTYEQNTIQQFAKVFTGWTFYPGAGNQPSWGTNVDGTTASLGPMEPVAAYHDTASKTLLNGLVLPAGQTAQQDLAEALDNIFNHPNVGPFVGKQLIQHLVRSNPSPAYISRVAAAFNNNGNGVRGDMQAVIAAVLLDPEARGNDAGGNDMPTDGHMQEPALFIPSFFRALGGTMSDQSYFGWDLVNMQQDIFNPPSVFNYFAPGAEMDIFTPFTSIYRANMIYGIFSAWSNPVLNWGPGSNIDVTPFLALASNPAALVDALDVALTHGDMPAAMKSIVVGAVTQESRGNLQRVEAGIYLILSSNYYNVWH